MAITKRRGKVRFHVPAAIAFTIVTGVHTVAAWAADAGPTDAGADASDSDGGRDPNKATCGGGSGADEEARRGTVTLFGSGCC